MTETRLLKRIQSIGIDLDQEQLEHIINEGTINKSYSTVIEQIVGKAY